MRKILTILLLIPIIAFGQGINERYDFGYDALSINSVNEYDDTLYIMGSYVDSGNKSRFVSKVSNDGNIIFQSIGFQPPFLYRCIKSELINNTIYKLNNFENSFEDSLSLIKINVSELPDFEEWRYRLPNSEGVRLFDLISHNSLNSIFGIGSNLPNPFDLDGLIIKLDTNGVLLWSKTFEDPLLDIEFSVGQSLNNGNLLIGGRKFDWMFPEPNDDIHHTYIMEVDSAGNIQWEWTDPENWTYMPYSISNTSDGGVIMGRTKAVVNQFGGNNSRCVITKLDATQNIEWELPLGEHTYPIGYEFNQLTGLVKINDTTFVFAGNYASPGHQNAVLIKITESGDVQWWREIEPPVTSQPQSSFIYDMTLTSDGGYVMVGESKDPEGEGANQQGWLIKTNCLGYLAPPSAACYAGNADNFEMVFYNNSLNGGEFDWDFGDGQSFTSGEGDTVNHTYAGAGPYNVRLIAKGCNGEADTIYFDVNPSVASINEAIEHGEGTFDLYPNPASDRVYVSINLPFESLPSATSGRTFEIVDINGKVHQAIPVYKNTYTQEVNISDLPKGIYFVNLFNEKGVIKSRKLVVQ